MSTDFLTKCEILSEVYIEATWNIQLEQFKKYNDIGLPLAHFFQLELVEMTEKGKEYVGESWEDLCNMLGLESGEEFENSDDMLEKSPVMQKLKEDEDEDDEDA